MKPHISRRFFAGVVSVLAITAHGSSQARADVGPMVEIKMPADTRMAISGQEYEGVFEVRVFRPGSLDDIRIEGDGWPVLSVDAPANLADTPVGTMRISFRAIPADANKPIGLTLTFDGRRVSQRYEVGSNQFARAKTGFRSVRLGDTKAWRADGATAGARITPAPMLSRVRWQMWSLSGQNSPRSCPA